MRQTVYLTRRIGFSAAHSYDVTSLSVEDSRRLFLAGADPAGHGHNYVIEATVSGVPDPINGMVVNIKEIDRILKEEVTDRFHQRFINREEPYFSENPSTTENLSVYAWGKVLPELKTGRLEKIRIEETPTLWSEFEGKKGPMVSLTRVFEFCASHRLHNARLSDEENRVLYGKCSNEHGHGHNYILEVTVRGGIDSKTGTVADLPLLESIVNEQIVDRLDHHNLNADIPEFRETVPTSENVSIFIWNVLTSKAPEIPWYKVKLWETGRNYFEYFGPTEPGIISNEA